MPHQQIKEVSSRAAKLENEANAVCALRTSHYKPRGREASQTRDLSRRRERDAIRAARPGPSLRKERWLRMTKSIVYFLVSQYLLINS